MFSLKSMCQVFYCILELLWRCGISLLDFGTVPTVQYFFSIVFRSCSNSEVFCFFFRFITMYYSLSFTAPYDYGPAPPKKGNYFLFIYLKLKQTCDLKKQFQLLKVPTYMLLFCYRSIHENVSHRVSAYFRYY